MSLAPAATIAAAAPVNAAWRRPLPGTDLDWFDPGISTVLFPRVRGVEDIGRFAERLLAERETAVVPGGFFDAPAHFRLGLGGTTESLRGGLERLGSALDERGW